MTIVISNQPDIARGYLKTFNYDPSLEGYLKQTELDKMTRILYNDLMIDDVLYCTHDDADNCNCRKPAPGLFFQAAEKWKINLQQSYMVGDTWKDAEAAYNAKVEFLLLNKDYNSDYRSPQRINNLKEIIKLTDRRVNNGLHK